MTTESRELFELCKQVYEATGWENDPYIKHLNKATKYEHRYGNASIYTSDYLLEKLPRYIYLQQSADGKSWLASQLQPTELRTAENAYQSINTSAGTPLRALLLLTLKLHEEGLL